MWKCMNKKVLIGLGVSALAVVALAPNLIGAALPMLLIAACPLSMIVMMRAMGSGDQKPTPIDEAARLRELEEEVNRLRAVRQLGVNDGSGA